MENLEKTTTMEVKPAYSKMCFTLGFLGMGIGLKHNIENIYALGVIVIILGLLLKLYGR